MGDAGACAIAKQFERLMLLQGLCLRGNVIGDAGVQSLARHFYHLRKTLQFLSLHGNRIGDAGAEAVAEHLHLLFNLQALYLTGNAVGARARSALARANVRPSTLRIQVS